VKLHRITDVIELANYLPLVAKTQEENTHIETDLDSTEFLTKLLKNFTPENYFFGNVTDNRLNYFAIIIPGGLTGSDKEAFFWVLYVNKELHEETKDILGQIEKLLRELGFAHVLFSTTDLRSSYARWAKKHGAIKKHIIYEKEL